MEPHILTPCGSINRQEEDRCDARSQTAARGECRWRLLICAALVCLAVISVTCIGWSRPAPAATDDSQAQASADQKKARQLLEFNVNEAAQYAFSRDRERREKLEFRKEPVYVWTNLV